METGTYNKEGTLLVGIDGEEYHGHPDFYKLTQEELKLHSRKNRDYSKGGEPLGNFKRVSAILKTWDYEIPPELVAIIYMLKQLDAVMWMLSQGYEGEVESVDARLTDVHIYAKLARILLRENKPPEPK